MWTRLPSFDVGPTPFLWVQIQDSAKLPLSANYTHSASTIISSISSSSSKLD